MLPNITSPAKLRGVVGEHYLRIAGLEPQEPDPAGYPWNAKGSVEEMVEGIQGSPNGSGRSSGDRTPQVGLFQVRDQECEITSAGHRRRKLRGARAPLKPRFSEEVRVM
ncbi:hypothetical protein MPDQ_002157 [Monascus purpureus]|uniref:Uncharacterized protein n=1 Tax=Monascus purpureus TaxID=5098 RepID=A0A507QQD0_MONPU|nr:hypothetical protein MPDQ_002157 [Monascus purpureus]